MDERVKEVFENHPSIDKIYVDTQGEIWLTKAAAKTQCKDGEPKTIERAKKSKDVAAQRLNGKKEEI